jgi:hypothetical protein
MERRRFNIYFVGGLLALVLAGNGCKSSEEDKKSKEAATLRFHLEVPQLPNGRSMPVEIFRASPFKLNVLSEPFLDEGDIERVIVVEEATGGFALQVKFNDHGRLVLQSTTVGHRSRRIAIYSTWTETRWLAAPVIERPYSDGMIVFTPDASREEAERIARGVNNLIAEAKKRSWVF